MQKILMVCLGNICRSPLAEGILKSKIDADFVSVDSAGTAAYHIGKLPDERSIEVAQKHGIDITKQRARKFVVKDFDEFDVIFAMDDSNYQNILSLARNNTDEQKVRMILNETHPTKNLSVPDPYYGGNEGFENVYKMLDEACDIIANNLS
ncbi:low molecular weight protein-tyrosine-phosphatase [Polaribacter undariae]|uniref:protein-tyrosine-phosphatase n=1 Tax=Polaribacter sejongensis TaxID=985043 RepID=A0AAJ1QTE6_9FLAO|nr:low molecular weight protein-tyrosine-phosphatase [Polaribacter undariae]MDN3617901.1 low molecular weight protein-tyrosine-phosphatase [Polaribacter undariae]UWD32067.1 low molecular weight phosphotyrosine protein phosphatase [Polaribacter undariae]